MMNSIGDEIVSTVEHECVICRRAVRVGEPVTAAAYDALLWPANPAALVWTHPACSQFHRDGVKYAPLYTTGWITLSRPQRCQLCNRVMAPGNRSTRAINQAQRTYQLTCSQCSSASDSSDPGTFVDVAHPLAQSGMLDAVAAEYYSAKEKHGEFSLDSPASNDVLRLAALVEEVGEVASALTYDGDQANLRAELIQAANVSLTWASVL